MYLTLCNHMGCSLPVSSHGISQARALEWVAISFSRGSFPRRDQTQVSHIVVRHLTVWATREVCLCQYHIILITVALQYSLKLGSMITPGFFFSKIGLAIQGLLWFYKIFRIICTTSVQNVIVKGYKKIFNTNKQKIQG